MISRITTIRDSSCHSFITSLSLEKNTSLIGSGCCKHFCRNSKAKSMNRWWRSLMSKCRTGSGRNSFLRFSDGERSPGGFPTYLRQYELFIYLLIYIFVSRLYLCLHAEGPSFSHLVFASYLFPICSHSSRWQLGVLGRRILDLCSYSSPTCLLTFVHGGSCDGGF